MTETNSKYNSKRRQSNLISSGGEDLRSTTLSLMTNSNNSTLTSVLNLKSNNLFAHDAYLISKRIKVKK